MRLFIILAAGVAMASTAIADDAVDRYALATCAAMSGDLDRLDCFDQLTREHGLDGPQPEPTDLEGTGKWQVRVEDNPIDDSRTVVLGLTADSGESRWGNPVVLVLRCQSNKTEAYITWREYLGSDVSVTSRVGDASAQAGRWSLSSDSQASFHPQPVAFIRTMLGEDRLVAQTTPYQESPVTAIFDLSGLDNAISPLRNTCGW